ncbi:beta-3-deoxy-D-manno-oct-2-ulosonic acid transferase [Roseomonas sp. 18066]|uniref:capsular polysaccharide export protein, LipB/KpsS family n=1 Tax=Roseomonas sp. 18066 TaxID=2681412 RepID=UPI00135BBB6A|nr:beta-3-deoxy-D-manno-oct-2-ulosonic acid transferase [Roseomonas sp. 18066]
MEETSPTASPATVGARIAFPAATAAEAAHLAAFWPECQLAPMDQADFLVLPTAAAPPARGPGKLLRYAPGPLRSPRFDGRHRPVALLPVAALPPCLRDAPLAAAPEATAEALARAEAFAARLATLRLGGEPSLPDPGHARLGLPRRAALLVLDPCRPDRAAAARAALAAAEAAFQLRPPTGARLLKARLSPWTLLDLAEDLYGAGPDMALLAAAAGVHVAGRTLPAAPRWAALLAHLRCADPFLSRPWSAEQALDQLAQWQQAQTENRRVAICLGMALWKRDRIAALFAHAGGAPGFTRRPARAIAEARARQGAVAAWAGAVSPGFRAECEAAGVPLLTVEDGFVRSRGLGARFLPGAAYAVDDRGIYYDPGRASALEHLLAITEFSPDLLARAARLRAAIVTRGVTKYNLHGKAPVIAGQDGRKKLLVPGQVEDDASVRLGGGAIQGNLALLRAVRDANPDAWLVYKPHPDLEAGFRRGRLPPEALDGLADQVVTGAPLTALFPQIDALHTLTSLSGFEALLRDVPVVTWGQPFYAGWGLTDDRAPDMPRRGRALSLDALVAATLILFPRQVDPLTELPCPPELILERLDDPTVWKVSRWTAHRGIEGWIRGLLARRKGLR